MNMREIQKRNRDAGQYFFEPDTMRFFWSRLPRETVDGSAFFVTSEQREWDTPRLFTIRQAQPDGSIDTIGDFQAYETRAAAVAEVRRILKAEHATV